MSVLDSVGDILTSPIGTAAQATALSYALAPIAGGAVPVQNVGGAFVLQPTDTQAENIAAWIIDQLDRKPGAIRFDASSVWPRVVFKKWWPYMAGMVVAGFVVGKVLK